MALIDRLIAGLKKTLSRSGDYRRRYGRIYGWNSVDYRRNRRALWRGEMPSKFRELAPHVPGRSVVDIGAGEGLLALELASHKERVRAIDITPRRHNTGCALQQLWQSKGRDVHNLEMLLGDALEDPTLLDGFETLVASRVIYYFGNRIDAFMVEATKRVRFICLVGNASRNRRYERNKLPADVGGNVVYSTSTGMKSLLERHGFETLDTGEAGGDPFVIGQSRFSARVVSDGLRSAF